MFKLIAFACIFAVAFAAPGGVVVAPVAHPVPVVAPVAVSHSSTHVVHNPPVVKVAAPVVAAPVVAAPVVKTVVAPVVRPAVIAPAVVAPAVVKTVVPAHPVLVH